MLRDWILSEVIGGPNGMGNPVVSGYFIDDFWCSNIINGTGACNDPVQGPTEIDAHSQADMGLSDQDIADITTGWLETMTAAQQAIVDAGAWGVQVLCYLMRAERCFTRPASMPPLSFPSYAMPVLPPSLSLQAATRGP